MQNFVIELAYPLAAVLDILQFVSSILILEKDF